MSAIAALLMRDGAAVDPAAISSITGSMARRGPDRLGTWHAGSIALGQASLLIVPEDRAPQPIRPPASGRAIVFDGRLDARADLAESAGVARRDVGALSDAALLLRAFGARGTTVFASLLGDFAFALWDAPNSTLICARDVLGLRPLYYTADDDELVVASEVQAVLRGRAAEPNLGMVAETLACRVTSRDETLFANVHKIPPGCMLVARGRSVQVTRFARLDAPTPLQYAHEEEYFEHFRDVLSAAVRDRLRCAGNIGVMLSGGVDSSTVYAAARACADVDAYTVGYEDPVLDETAAARAVVDINGGRHHRVGLAAATYDYGEEIREFRDVPTSPCGANSASLRRRASANGVRVFLTGVGGDEWFFGHTGRWADWLCSGAWLLLWRELKTWRYSSDPTSWRELARTTAQPLIPPALRRAYRAMRPGHRPFPWMADSFLRETHLLDRVRRVPDASGPTYATAGMLQAMAHGGTVAAWEEQERLAARFQQDERMPYMDRRVIDFALAIPETLRSRPGCPKYITRQAWAAHLPREVLSAPEPPDYGLQFVDALEAQGGAVRFDDLVIADIGWVEGNAVRRMSQQLFTTARASRRYLAYAWPLWCVVTVDEWYRRALAAQAPSRPVPAIAAGEALGLH